MLNLCEGIWNEIWYEITTEEGVIEVVEEEEEIQQEEEELESVEYDAPCHYNPLTPHHLPFTRQQTLQAAVSLQVSWKI